MDEEELAVVRDIIRDLLPSAWDSFWPTFLATVIGALVAAAVSFALYLLEARRSERNERREAVRDMENALSRFGDALIDRSNEKADAALAVLGYALSRFRLMLRKDEKYIDLAVGREFLWWPQLPLDEMSNRSQLLRSELIRWARGEIASSHFKQRWERTPPSSNETMESPETLPERLRNVNRDVAEGG